MPCNGLAVVINGRAIAGFPQGMVAGDGMRGLAGDAQPEAVVNKPPCYDSRIPERTVELARQARIAD